MPNEQNHSIEIITSSDGSHTLYVPELNEHYHSINGAVQESMHVFIQAGLMQITKQEINLLEIGFGTGLNALLTNNYINSKKVYYHTIEKFPLEINTIEKLNYQSFCQNSKPHFFSDIHKCAWDMSCPINP